MTQSYDVAILGSGPGGYVAAVRAAQLGMNVALVEREHLGGICLNWGCIPTKALLRNAEVVRTLTAGREFGFQVDTVTLDYAAAVNRSRKIARRLTQGVALLMKKNSIPVIWGQGKLLSPTRLQVTLNEGGEAILQAEHIILATGARTRLIPGWQADGRQILTAKHALSRRDLPRSAVIIGAGPIGLEFATVWASYGTRVTVVERMPHILPAEDEEATAVLARSLRRQKIKTLVSTRVEGLRPLPQGVQVQISSPRGDDSLEAEIALVAIGVRPNSEALGLEELGVTMTRSWVQVNDRMQTNLPTLYAIGDLNGRLPLAHVAAAQGILAVETIAGRETAPFNVDLVPRGTYTTPQVASFGLSEAQAQAQGRPVRVGKFPFLPNGKALALGENQGFVKIVADATTHQIIGSVIVGAEATELLPELILAAKSGLRPEELANTIHAHPTLNEAVMEAAHSVFGKAIHAS